jgi:hypothetical protein
MKWIESIKGNAADAITGERIFPGERVFDTEVPNRKTAYLMMFRTRVLKEETIVSLAEAAGYTVIKRDAGDSGNAEVVDGEDVSVGGGEVEVGEAPVGGKPAAKRRSSGASKGK